MTGVIFSIRGFPKSQIYQAKAHAW